MKTVFAMFCFLSILVGAVGERPNCTPMERDKWIRSALNEMQTIKVGMTRKDFMKVFTVTGGFFRSTRLKGTYAYKGSSYIMVDVEFAPAPDMDSGKTESPSDSITAISKPYLSTPLYD